MMDQITSKIIMVRPANFGFNPETAVNNSFQTIDEEYSKKELSKIAIEEFDSMVQLLRNHGIEVLVWEDTANPVKPDAIFPNNWFSTHADNSILTYPMYAEVRRLERREDLIDSISNSSRRYSFENYESEGKYLEGTGSMILDRENKIVYACLSQRTNIEVLNKFSVLRGFKTVYFTSVDKDNEPIYHTNVMMGLGEKFAAICLDSISNLEERKSVVNVLEETGKEIIDLGYNQINNFAGNLIQLKNTSGDRFIVMSKQAKDSLTSEQLNSLEKHGKILCPDISTIENTGGGSARCMIAENYLP